MSHAIELQARGYVRSRRFYNRPGDDAVEHKGDLWSFAVSAFGIPGGCVRINDIEKVFVIESSNDGWNIQSIVTIVRDQYGGFQLLTRDFDVNQWIDGNAHHSHERFELTLN